MLSFFKKFHNNEDGVVTVDWVVLAAAIIGLAIAAYSTIESSSTKPIGDAIGAENN